MKNKQKKNNKIQKTLIWVIVGFLLLFIAITVILVTKNNKTLREYLDESIKSELLSISIAAAEIINEDEFISYNSKQDIADNFERYSQTLTNLRSLQSKTVATYIYAVKMVDGEYYFVFDTDEDEYGYDPFLSENIFDTYDEDNLSTVHFSAFEGKTSAGIMNVTDEWGSYNTGAVPLYKDGKIIGIVCVDIADHFIKEYNKTSYANIFILMSILIIAMLAKVYVMLRLAISPIRKLTDSVAESEMISGTVYGIDRDDEYGLLASTIQNMWTDINAALEEAKVASVAKSNFLSNMSHEIRTPLNAIIGMTSIGKMEKSIEKKEYALSVIGDASEHLLGIVDDILDISKIETGNFTLECVDFKFNKIFKNAISILDSRIKEKRQHLTLKMDKNIPPLLYGDDKRIVQVITNLLSNAVKFTGDEGLIGVSASLLGIDDGVCEIQISVTDTGIGISSENQNKMFEPFVQVEENTSRKFGGTGLGLPIAKTIVGMMGGSISVKSELGKGSEFTFNVKLQVSKLTAKEFEQNKSESDRANFDGTFKNKCILIAEDVDINREVIAAILEPSLVNIDFAVDGNEAVRMFTENPDKYGLIFMDLQMPETDGLTATRLIRSLPSDKARNVPIIAMTANVFKKDIEACLEAGMNGHLGKPLEIREVFKVLKQYLT